MYKLRRKFQKALKLNEMGTLPEAKKRYYEARKEYERLIYVTRTESWKAFITEACKNPWGYAYKMSCNRIKGETAINSVRRDDVFTIDWRQSAENLLDGLFCYDDPTMDTEEQKQIRYQAESERFVNSDMSILTEENINEAILKMKTGKAPGWDRIEVAVLKRAWELDRKVLTEMFNGCWRTEVFPKEWKKALVVTLLKSEDKDKSDPSSYRPICLLPVAGKVMERLMMQKLNPVV